MDLELIRLRMGNQNGGCWTVQVRGEQPEEANQDGEDGHCGGGRPGWWDPPTV